MRKLITTTVPCILLLVCLLSMPAVGQNLMGTRTRGIVGLKAGLITRGHIDADERYRTEVARSAQVYADLPITRSLFYNVAIDFHDIRLFSDHQWMIDVSVGFKPVFRHDHLKMEFKPGLLVGYGYIARVNVFEATNYLTFKLFLETHFDINRRKRWVVELGIIRAPLGRNNELDATLGPMILIRGGVTFR